MKVGFCPQTGSRVVVELHPCICVKTSFNNDCLLQKQRLIFWGWTHSDSKVKGGKNGVQFTEF